MLEEISHAESGLQLRRHHRDVRELYEVRGANQGGSVQQYHGNSGPRPSGGCGQVGPVSCSLDHIRLHPRAEAQNSQAATRIFRCTRSRRGRDRRRGAAMARRRRRDCDNHTRPGMNLKRGGRAAVKSTLPLVITIFKRAGTVNGYARPTAQGRPAALDVRTECESPIPIIAASTPADCF